MTNHNQEQTHPLVIFMPSGRRGHIEAGQSLLDAARRMGVDIESICGGRLTCGKCKVRVEEGTFQKHGVISSASHLSPPLETETELLERLESSDCRLSCTAYVQGDMLVTVPEESRAQKQIIRKSATERVVEIVPAIQQVYVEVDQPQLGKHRGDWGRLQDALSEQWQLENLSIDLKALQRLQPNLRKGKWTATVTLWHNREVIGVRPGYEEGMYGLAVDIGSTTIAGHLCDLRTGKILATESLMNPQVTYGEDLMSRISYAMMNADGLKKMHTAVLEALQQLVSRVAKQADLRVRHIYDAVMVGNTTMLHILLGINPTELGGAPFALANRDSMDVKARDLGLRLHPGAYIHIMPSEAGHVGADNVAVMIAEEPYRQDDQLLIVDVGTNAEIALGNRAGMFSASSPTGPAFEGVQITYGIRATPGAIERVRIDPVSKEARFRVIGDEQWSDEWQTGPNTPADDQPHNLAIGICGSGIIEAVAQMYLTGIILPDGRFNPAIQSERIQGDGHKGAYILATEEQTTTDEAIRVTQEDVRNIQLAKAALYAGAKLLMNHAKIKTVDRIILAGAFGSFIDPKHAMILGLIPDCELDKVYAVGNAAGDGARIALLNINKREEAQAIAHWIKYIETAVDPDFQTEFVNAIHLPNKNDSFPHLADILSQVPAHKENTGTERRGRRRRQHMVGG